MADREDEGRERLTERDRERDTGEGYEAADATRPGSHDPLTRARRNGTDDEHPDERRTAGMDEENARWELEKQLSDDGEPEGTRTASRPLSADELPGPETTQG
jgi:hypothetical protein